MKMLLVRAGAFVVGSMIAGCVYAESGTATKAAGFAMPAPTFPASHPTVGDRNGDNADVTVQLAVVRLHLRAVRYRAQAPASAVIAFYERKLSALGPVSVERGGPHTSINGFHWVQGPGQMTVGAGHTFVGIAPNGKETEYAIIDVDTQPSGAR